MAKDMTNSEIALLLRQVAAAFEVKDTTFFRTRAYQNAATSIENTTTSLHTLWEQGKLDEVPGVGKSLQEHLHQLFTTGHVNHFINVTKNLPPVILLNRR